MAFELEKELSRGAPLFPLCCFGWIMRPGAGFSEVELGA